MRQILLTEPPHTIQRR